MRRASDRSPPATISRTGRFRGLPLILGLLLAASAAAAADPVMRTDPPPGGVPDPGLESLAWMAGHWRGEALGGTAEDVWAPPAGGQMVGLFRSVRDGRVQFYEILTLLYVDGRLTLRLKHFDAELHGWEARDETVDFPLVDQRDDVWWFDGLTIERRGPDGMTIHVNISDDGRESVLPFVYERVRD